ncbi:AMP-binding protein [Corynebacterium sp. Q4381]|uniref:AMP-binding protein n=1 Tax=Corynebacterium sp. Marseille-Q4381 TaxID=3121597 RepID=UPI002FE67ADB
MFYASPLPDIALPNTDIFSLVFGGLGADAALPAITEVDSGRTLSYGELRDMAERVASGVADGEVVALRQPNSAAFAAGLFGIARAGGVAVLLGHVLTSAEADHLTTLSRAARVIDPAEQPRDSFAPPARIDPQQVAVIPFSSGTTGLPKPVQLTHAAVTANAAQFGAALRASGIERGTRTFAPLPFSHIYGLNTLLLSSLAARHHVHTTARFNLEEMVRVHREHAIELSFIAPPIARMLAKEQLDERAFDACRFMVCGAASLDEDLARAVERRLDLTILQGYGMTETAPVTHVGIAGKSTPGSIGFAVPNTQYRIVDLEHRADVAAGDAGELLVRGPQLMRGYLGQPPLEEGAWLKTGDLARQLDNGTVEIVDRVKDVFKYRGYQVSPAELEAVLLTHPQVADAAVAGVKRDGQDVPWGFVVFRGASTSNEALMRWVAARVAPYKKLRGVTRVDEIPRNAAGKILRRKLPGAVGR